MADTLDQDVQALKEWQASAWRFLADPSSTRFERQELRNYMKEADAALRAGLQKLAARETAGQDRYGNYSWAGLPDFRVLNIRSERWLAALRTHRCGLLDPGIAENRGRIIKTTGDGLLTGLASVVDATCRAVDVQRVRQSSLDRPCYSSLAA
jgi:hypothetical protein